MLHKNSCFLDCLAMLLERSPLWLHHKYLGLATLSNPEDQGYHPQVFALLVPISELVIAPTANGAPLLSSCESERRMMEVVTSEACIAVGPKTLGGSEHAIFINAHRNAGSDGLWDPSVGNVHVSPIKIRSLWVIR